MVLLIDNDEIHFRILAKTLRLSRGDHLHSGIVEGKLKEKREITLSLVDLIHETSSQKITIVEFILNKSGHLYPM